MAFAGSVRRGSFNPRPRVGGDRCIITAYAYSIVSTHAPAWGATNKTDTIYTPSGVSTHAPAWGATSNKTSSAAFGRFQPTPPRGGRPAHGASGGPFHGVSTHAPAWGATGTVNVFCFKPMVSTHAPAWGATWRKFSINIINYCFNPRPRVGGDEYTCTPSARTYRFNPRPRVGGDVYILNKNLLIFQFQPTPPRGGRHLVH